MRGNGRERARADRWTNLALGVLLLSAVLTGLAANTQGTTAGAWLVVLHGIFGIGLVVLSRAKSRIAARSLGRPRRRRGWRLSLVLAVLVLTVVLTGLLSASGLTDRLGPLRVMQIHIGAAVIALPVAGIHLRQRPEVLRPVPAPSADRRTVLRTGVVTALAAGGWFGWERMLQATGTPGGQRRWTGSHEVGSGDPGALPVTQWLDDPVLDVDPGKWQLVVDGRSWDLDALRRLPQEEITTVLDCTSLWWSTQTWSGVRLDRLVQAGQSRSIWVRSLTGYGIRLPVRDLDAVWLALDHGGQPLSRGHGFPARLVAPDRRGFWWVKWVSTIDTSDVPWWVQPPFPLT